MYPLTLLKPKIFLLWSGLTLLAVVTLGAVVAVDWDHSLSKGWVQTAIVDTHNESGLQQSVPRKTGADVQEENRREYPWKANSVCQAVYEAVLEGLYRDNVSDAIISNIIGEKSQDRSPEMMQARMKRSFVLNCPLCEPTFEAFHTYQMRDKQEEDEATSQEGRSVNAEIEQKLQKRLLSKRAGERTSAMGRVTEKWISLKLYSKNQFNSVEIQAWKDRILKRAAEGKEELMKLITSTEHYKEWSLYTGCGACNGAKFAALGWE